MMIGCREQERKIGIMRVNDGVFTNETFMDTLESAAGIDFRNYVTHYEADTSLMKFELYMNKKMVNEFISHYDTQGQLVFIILIELMQARHMIDPDVRFSRICVYDSETQDLLYDTGKNSNRINL